MFILTEIQENGSFKDTFCLKLCVKFDAVYLEIHHKHQRAKDGGTCKHILLNSMFLNLPNLGTSLKICLCSTKLKSGIYFYFPDNAVTCRVLLVLMIFSRRKLQLYHCFSVYKFGDSHTLMMKEKMALCK